MDEAIITVLGKQYLLQPPPGCELAPADIQKAEQDIRAVASASINVMNPAVCADVVQGTPHQVTLNATGGQPNYTYKIYVDGVQVQSYGPAPDTSHIFSITFNTAGTYTLMSEVTDQCAVPQTASDSCTINVTAPPTKGSINFTTTPPGASIALDGNNMGLTTPATLNNVDAGIHTVTFTLTGYNICQKTVSVPAGGSIGASCTLTLACPPLQITMNVAV